MPKVQEYQQDSKLRHSRQNHGCNLSRTDEFSTYAADKKSKAKQNHQIPVEITI